MGVRRYDWCTVQRFHDAGHGMVECCKRFGFTHTAWVKAIRRGELVARYRTPRRSAPVSDRRRIYNWPEVQRFYDEGHTYAECREKFGFCSMTWQKARQRGELVTRSPGMPLDTLLSGSRARSHVKRRLLHAGLLENKCSICGIADWLGQELHMHIDHINGVGDDHRLENLRMLCPNCHSQTATYSGRNVRLRRLQDGDRIV